MSRHRLSCAFLDDASLGGSQAFVYVIVAMAGAKVVFYVGQTRQRMGAIGRLAEHLSGGTNATFRQRVWDVAQAEVAGAVHFAAIALSGERAFQQSAPDYREAVECLVESDLREFVVANELAALSVARVKMHAYRSSPVVQRESQRSLDALRSWLSLAIRSVTESDIHSTLRGALQVATAPTALAPPEAIL
jgi:hypothetical protein